jgi:ribosomal-protein-alanine N-acetyltransferase
MSAVLKDAPVLAPMREADLDEVMAIESAIYSHPWTEGNFADSLHAGYQCWTWRQGGTLVGYFVLMVAAGEGHLLNLSVAADWQRRGHGGALLEEVMRLARERRAEHIFLEVRPTNAGAKALYRRFGFRQVAVRPGYYPATSGREDALVLTIQL